MDWALEAMIMKPIKHKIFVDRFILGFLMTELTNDLDFIYNQNVALISKDLLPLTEF